MTPDELRCGLCRSEGSITWDGWNPGTCETYIRVHATGVVWGIPLESMADARWVDLLGVVTGTRDQKVLRHVTRIVGYYSDLANWNGSKIAERKARASGNYALPEPSPMLAPAPQS